MLCFHPRDVKVHQKVTFYHYVDRYVRVPCGKCLACRRRRQQDWSFRVQKEAEHCRSLGGCVYFVTLTLDNEHLSYLTDKDTGEVSQNPTLDTLEIGNFMRRMRKRFGADSMRYFGCGEYGDHVTDNLRPHYHIVLFLKDNLTAESLRPSIESCWKKGLVLGIHELNTKLAEYVAKYSMKRVGFDYSDRVPPFARMSLKPAIGACYLASPEAKLYKLQESFILYDWTGTRYAIPRYFRDRMYSKDLIDARRISFERQILTLNEVSIRKDPLCLFKRYQANVRYEENFINSISRIC